MSSVGDFRRYVIVGNGFAGTTAAEQLRKHDPSCSITLFTDEPYTLYNRIALPPMLRKQVTEQKVIMRDLEWHEKHKIELHLETRVERVVSEERVVQAGGNTVYGRREGIIQLFRFIPRLFPPQKVNLNQAHRVDVGITQPYRS